MIRTICLVLTAVAAIAGCTPLQLAPQATRPMYELDVAAANVDASDVRWQIVIEEPLAPTALDTARIAVTPASGELRYLEEASWRDRTPLVVEDLLIQALEGAQLLGVAREALGIRGDFRLITTLRHFEARYPEQGAPSVLVEVGLKLIGEREARIVAARAFRTEVTAPGRESAAVAAAFQQAADQMILEVIPWLLASANEAYDASL